MSIEDRVMVSFHLRETNGSLALNRITVPYGPLWIWELEIRDQNGESLAGIDLTTVDLQKLHDLIA